MMNRNWLVTADDYRFDSPLDIDAIPEFHAARLVLVMSYCGRGSTGMVQGRTKLAKLDFFVRYPRFLEAALQAPALQGFELPDYEAGDEGVEARMVRYKYGPWDHRYFDLLGLLIGRGLLREGGGSVATYSLTDNGMALAKYLAHLDEFSSIVERCKLVNSAFGHLSGTQLKTFVYDTFVSEVADLALGSTIGPVAMRTDGENDVSSD